MSTGATSEILPFISRGGPWVVTLRIFILSLVGESEAHRSKELNWNLELWCSSLHLLLFKRKIFMPGKGKQKNAMTAQPALLVIAGSGGWDQLPLRHVASSTRREEACFSRKTVGGASRRPAASFWEREETEKAGGLGGGWVLAGRPEDWLQPKGPEGSLCLGILEEACWFSRLFNWCSEPYQVKKLVVALNCT